MLVVLRSGALIGGLALPTGSRYYTALCWLSHIFADATTNLFCFNYRHFLSNDLMKEERERALTEDKIQPNFEPCIGETVQPHHTDRTLEKQTCSLLLLLSSPHQLACLITEGWGSGMPPVRSTLLSPLCPSQHIRKCNIAIHSCIKQSDSFKEASQ